MPRCVITVDFVLHEGTMKDFMPHMVDNANKSRTLEPGCDRFDVLVSPKAPDRVFLYEIYQDRAAFEVHLKTEHFLEFSEKTRGYIKDRTIWEFAIENDNGN